MKLTPKLNFIHFIEMTSLRVKFSGDENELIKVFSEQKHESHLSNEQEVTLLNITVKILKMMLSRNWERGKKGSELLQCAYYILGRNEFVTMPCSDELYKLYTDIITCYYNVVSINFAVALNEEIDRVSKEELIDRVIEEMNELVGENEQKRSILSLFIMKTTTNKSYTLYKLDCFRKFRQEIILLHYIVNEVYAYRNEYDSVTDKYDEIISVNSIGAQCNCNWLFEEYFMKKSRVNIFNISMVNEFLEDQIQFIKILH